MNQHDLQAFTSMTAAADATSVNIFENKAEGWSDEAMHTALDIAGLLPIVGNAADAFNAATYAMEGEFGKAALSLTALVPIVGQMATVNKLAKESGEKMITLYRGVDKWYPGKMVVNGKFVGGSRYLGDMKGVDPKSPWVTTSREYASGEAFGRKSELLMEFKIPESWYNTNFIRTGIFEGNALGIINGGIPKEFLTKVIK